jgi:G3E family GTPase
VILLNKCDLVSEEALHKLEHRLRHINATAKIHRTTKGVVDLKTVLNVGGFNLEKVLEQEPDFLKAAQDSHDHHHHDHKHDEHEHGEDCHEGCTHEHHEHDHQDEPRHDAEVSSVGIVLEGDVDAKKVNQWLSQLLGEKGADIYRLKGILALRGDKHRYVIQGVHMQLDSGPTTPWASSPRVNKLVFIGRNLDREALNAGFKNCLA